MPELLYVAKAATPEDLDWRQRISRNEKGLLAAFVAWVAEIKQHIGDNTVALALVTSTAAAFDHVFRAVAFQPQTVLEQTAVAEATREFQRTMRTLDASLRLSFDQRNPNFAAMLDRQGSRLVREVKDETRQSVNNVLARAYRDGLHPYEVAPQIQSMVGLTRRQGQAVLNYRAQLVKGGRNPEAVAAQTDRYSARMLKARGQTIARTETARVMTAARIASYQQAGAAGLFNPATAELEWSSVQQDPTEICAQLDGQRVSLGGDFDGLLPPAHPSCRCSVHLVL